MFPCCFDIQDIVSTHVESIVLLQKAKESQDVEI